MASSHRWIFVTKVVILLYQTFLQNSHSCSSGEYPIQTWNKSMGSYSFKNILLISAEEIDHQTTFPSNAVDSDGIEIKLCFNIQENKTHAACCHTGDFNCTIEVRRLGTPTEDRYSLTLHKEILSKQDIVVMITPDANFSCMPSNFSSNTDFFLNIHKCLDTGKKNIRLSQDGLCGKHSPYQEAACRGLEGIKSQYVIMHESNESRCVSCEPPNIDPVTFIIVNASDFNDTTSPEEAVKVMNELSSLLDQMGNSNKATIKIGNVTGGIAKLPPQNQTSLNFGFTSRGDIIISEGKGIFMTNVTLLVNIPEEACKMAVKKNGSFTGVLLFPGWVQGDANNLFFNNEVLGIEMGAKISNLSQTIDIHYSNVNKRGNIASCRSWDGKAGSPSEPNWVTDGCQTKETKENITCQCSHLTFFAILLSPPSKNISTSDFKSLTYITSIGCGLSTFFLAVALFMHFFIRNVRANRATKILINLLVAMLILNLSFLVNADIAKLENFIACMAIAMILHYSMLATFTWFFMQALHLYFHLRKIPAEIKHYIWKICIAGWATPAVVVIAFLATQEYDFVDIYTSDGNSVKMCWISDAAVHQGVNIGYYAIVFVFTFIIFVVTVRHITQFKSAAGKGQGSSSTKANLFSILGLFSLLGITWAFAFFSYGTLLQPSYYIFTILNSFQGFFLFLYHHKSRKIIREDKKVKQNISSIDTIDTAVSSSG
ncbi:adhesion G-protein coupled receptor G5-like isoform 2-T2 [Odontesthes bonariensis]|uniref:adhesion G-protein coupled receptor G5-like isoform X2 n=1 Tax=Odontesthes bonariensis TaxID=219752 RepID=UPI003F586BDA